MNRTIYPLVHFTACSFLNALPLIFPPSLGKRDLSQGLKWMGLPLVLFCLMPLCSLSLKVYTVAVMVAFALPPHHKRSLDCEEIRDLQCLNAGVFLPASIFK